MPSTGGLSIGTSRLGTESSRTTGALNTLSSGVTADLQTIMRDILAGYASAEEGAVQNWQSTMDMGIKTAMGTMAKSGMRSSAGPTYAGVLNSRNAGQLMQLLVGTRLQMPYQAYQMKAQYYQLLNPLLQYGMQERQGNASTIGVQTGWGPPA
jgi:hypothetical protein